VVSFPAAAGFKNSFCCPRNALARRGTTLSEGQPERVSRPGALGYRGKGGISARAALRLASAPIPLDRQAGPEGGDSGWACKGFGGVCPPPKERKEKAVPGSLAPTSNGLKVTLTPSARDPGTPGGKTGMPLGTVKAGGAGGAVGGSAATRASSATTTTGNGISANGCQSPAAEQPVQGSARVSPPRRGFAGGKPELARLPFQAPMAKVTRMFFEAKLDMSMAELALLPFQAHVVLPELLFQAKWDMSMAELAMLPFQAHVAPSAMANWARGQVPFQAKLDMSMANLLLQAQMALGKKSSLANAHCPGRLKCQRKFPRKQAKSEEGKCTRQKSA